MSETTRASSANWWVRMSEYVYEVKHQPGNQTVHVYALSRNPVAPTDYNQTADSVLRNPESIESNC